MTNDQAIEWGKLHPKEMALKKNPYNMQHPDYIKWVIAKRYQYLDDYNRLKAKADNNPKTP